MMRRTEKDTRIVWINRTERLARKNIQGSYVVYLDDKDIDWINKRKED